MFNKSLSATLARLTRAAPKECYRNAVLAIPHAERLAGRVSYIEGFVVMADIPIPIEHGWLETDLGILDPSPSFLTDTPRTYIAYRRYTSAQVMEYLSHCPTLPISLSLEATPWRDVDYMAARTAALEAAGIYQPQPPGALPSL